jgi:hypothetical protein
VRFVVLGFVRFLNCTPEFLNNFNRMCHKDAPRSCGDQTTVTALE